jgi:Protein of unknown function (DUF4239)
MKPMTISLITFACVFGGSLAGMVLRMMVPERHFSHDAQDVIKLGLGLIVTMNALVLGLLISTAKTSYDTKRGLLTEIAADVILADRSLALYGSEAEAARIALHELVSVLIEQVQNVRDIPLGTSSSGSKVGAADFYQIVRKLSPRDDEQKALKAEVLRISLEVAQIRASALTQEGSSIPMPFLIVLIFWLAILFIGFGLFAPPNVTVLAALCVCAFSVAAAIFMVVEMDEAFVGVMRISSEPLRNALALIGK